MSEAAFLIPSPRSDEAELVDELIDQINESAPLADGVDARSTWDALVESGLHAVLLDPEASADHGLAFAGDVAEGLGAGLNADAFVWGAVAAPLLLRAAASDDPLAERIIDGALPAVGLHAPSGHLEEIGSSLVLEGAGEPTVSGTVAWVPLARQADLVLVVARGDSGPVLAEVLARERISWTDLEPFDLRTSLAHGRLERVPVRVIGALDAPLEELLAPVLYCQAAALAGSARRALTDAVEYSRTREQFGVTIASFQAVRHRLAESLLELELMRATLRNAADADDPHTLRLAAYHCFTAAPTIARANIQVHGGIGYTWEHSAHRHFRFAYAGREAVVSLESLERLLMSRLVEPADA